MTSGGQSDHRDLRPGRRRTGLARPRHRRCSQKPPAGVATPRPAPLRLYVGVGLAQPIESALEPQAQPTRALRLNRHSPGLQSRSARARASSPAAASEVATRTHVIVDAVEQFLLPQLGLIRRALSTGLS